MWNLRSWKEVGGSRSRRAGGKLLRRMWDPRTALLSVVTLLLQLFLQLLLQFGTSQLFLTLRSFPVSSLIFYIFGERIDLSSSSIPALSYSSSCLCSSVWTLSVPHLHFNCPLAFCAILWSFWTHFLQTPIRKEMGGSDLCRIWKVAVTKIRKADAPCILSTILTNRLFSVVVQTKECCPTFTGSSVFDRGSETSKYGRPD